MAPIRIVKLGRGRDYMNKLLGAAVLIMVFARGGLGPPARVPVLVELFTSEGCSSCPPADALLESLLRDQPVDGVEVIPIGLHVDYFDYLGWKDSFGSPSYTARQQDYSQIFGPDSVYTPQIVVDGTAALSGAEGDLVRRAIGSAGGRPHLPLRVSARDAGGRLRITIDLPAAPADAEKLQVVAAITEDGLSTVVRRGENRGRTLQHVAVARHLQRLDALTGEAAVVEVQLPLRKTWTRGALKAVVWIQGVKSRTVYAAAVAPVAA
jgi:hypothetical protein